MRNVRLIGDTDSDLAIPTDPLTRQSRFESMLGAPQRWTDGMTVLKYIDNTNGNEKLCVQNAATTYTTTKKSSRVHAEGSEHLFKTISENARGIGIKVNPSKTQMQYMNACIDSDVSSFIRVGAQEIDSGEHLKILGFHFGNRPTVEDQVQVVIKKLRSRSWCIRHLKRAGLKQSDLLALYKSLVRPVADYSAVVYGPMLKKIRQKGSKDSNDRFQKSYLGTISHTGK